MMTDPSLQRWPYTASNNADVSFADPPKMKSCISYEFVEDPFLVAEIATSSCTLVGVQLRFVFQRDLLVCTSELHSATYTRARHSDYHLSFFKDILRKLLRKCICKGCTARDSFTTFIGLAS